MGPGAIGISAGQNAFTLSALESEGSLVLVADDKSRYPDPCGFIAEEDFEEFGVPQPVTCVWGTTGVAGVCTWCLLWGMMRSHWCHLVGWQCDTPQHGRGSPNSCH